MNLIKFVLLICGICLAVGFIGERIAYGIYEDQSFICKQTNHIGNQHDKRLVCILVNDDNVLSSDGLDTTMQMFKYDLDTFSVEYLREID